MEIIRLNSVAVGGADNILKVGYSSDAFYMREWAGVNKETGAPQWYKTAENGSRVITENYSEADQVIYPPSTPKLFGGFNTSLRWKDIDMSAVFGYSIGGKIYNYSRLEYDSDGTYTDRNQMKLKRGGTVGRNRVMSLHIRLHHTTIHPNRTKHLLVISRTTTS